MKLIKKYLLLTIALGISGLSIAQSPSIRIQIAATTDVHGALFPVDWFKRKESSTSLAQVYQWVQEARNHKEDLILLDNGDLIQGDPATYYSNFIQPDQANIAARVLSFMKYDAATIGNHDIETGHPVYDALEQEFPFPWMGANVIDLSTGEPYFQPYTILERKGKKIAVLGLTTPKVPSWLPPVLWSGMEFRDMVNIARYWMKVIQTKEHPDLVIGLFHSGVNPGYNNANADPFLNENASRLVPEMVNGFDVVFAGHDHREWNLWVKNPDGDSTLVIGSESRAREFAVVDITWPATESSETEPSMSGTHINTSDYSPEPHFIKAFSGYMDTIQRYVDEPLTKLTQPISSDDAYFGPNPFMDIIHRAQLDLSGAQISFAAPLSFQTNLPAGDLTVGSLFQLYRYENLLYALKLTGKEIQLYLNYSYSLWVDQMASKDDPMLQMVQSANGQWRFSHPYYNFDSAAGIDYEVDLTKPAGQMVRIIRLSNGQPFHPDSSYIVAMNSYRGSGGGGHLTQGVGLSADEIQKRLIWVSENDFRYHLMGWMKKRSTLEPMIISKWSFIPEDWVKEARELGLGEK